MEFVLLVDYDLILGELNLLSNFQFLVESNPDKLFSNKFKYDKLISCPICEGISPVNPELGKSIIKLYQYYNTHPTTYLNTINTS